MIFGDKIEVAPIPHKAELDFQNACFAKQR